MSTKAIWTGHILRTNCLLRGAIEGRMTEVKGAGRRTQLTDDSREKRRYWELKEEVKYWKKWNGRFNNLSHEHKEEIQVLFHTFEDLLTSSIVYLSN